MSATARHDARACTSTADSHERAFQRSVAAGVLRSWRGLARLTRVGLRVAGTTSRCRRSFATWTRVCNRPCHCQPAKVNTRPASLLTPHGLRGVGARACRCPARTHRRAAHAAPHAALCPRTCARAHWPTTATRRGHSLWLGPIAALKARAVLIDMEEGVINQLSQGPLGDLFDAEQKVTSVSGSGNNWAVGHYTYGAQYHDEISETVGLTALARGWPRPLSAVCGGSQAPRRPVAELWLARALAAVQWLLPACRMPACPCSLPFLPEQVPVPLRNVHVHACAHRLACFAADSQGGGTLRLPPVLYRDALDGRRDRVRAGHLCSHPPRG